MLYNKTNNLTKKVQDLCGLQTIFLLFNCQTPVESADHKMFFLSAFFLADAESGIAILQSTATDRTDRSVITALNKNTGIDLVGQCVI